MARWDGFLRSGGMEATFPPTGRSELEDEGVDPGSWRAADRLKRMDEYGIYAESCIRTSSDSKSPLFMRLGDEVSLACARVYNDFLTEWSSADPERA